MYIELVNYIFKFSFKIFFLYFIEWGKIVGKVNYEFL